LKERELELCRDQQQALSDRESELKVQLPETVEAWKIVDRFFPQLKRLKPGHSGEPIPTIRGAIARDVVMIRKIYEAIRQPSFPESDLIGPEWVIYRWLQVYLIAAVDYYVTNPGRHDRLINEKVDVDYTVIATLAAGLASRDAGMIGRFKLLRPDGVLIN
jgi:hypothetical protein